MANAEGEEIQVSLRLNPVLHDKVMSEALENDRSMHWVINKTLEERFGSREPNYELLRTKKRPGRKPRPVESKGGGGADATTL